MPGKRITSEEYQRLIEQGCIPRKVKTEDRQDTGPYMTFILQWPGSDADHAYWASGEDVARIKQLMLGSCHPFE
jgi:hypothetical protein